MIIRKIVLIAAMLITVSFPSVAIENFIVEDIKVRGLQRVAQGVALTHIPINIGDELNKFRLTQSIKSLYKSGHFNNIAVYRDGGTIIFRVRERETINEITFEGNKDIKDEQLSESLNDQNIRVGETLDKTILTSIELGLENFYHGVGKYNADVNTEITHLPRNRVNILIKFKEGDAAKIEQINVVGNEIFTDEELLKATELTFASPWWDFMSPDRYQKQTLEGDMEIIKSYYLDRGYLKYKVESTQVSMTPDKKAVYIALNVSEGEQYTVSEVDFVGDMAGFEPIVRRMSPLRTDVLYSGATVTYTEDMISKFYSRYGYAYPKVTTIPEINEEDKTVKLTVSIDPGKRVYVDRINFSGNNVTADGVLRRELRQLEGAWLSNSYLESSKQWLQRLPYLENIEFETKPIPEKDDKVEVDFTVKEQPSGSFTAGIGYGDTTKLSLNAGIQQNNFLGTGNSLGLSINTVSYSRSMNLSYTDPYFTVDGVSLGGNIYYNEFDAGSANLEKYKNKTYGVGLNVGFPINEYVRVNFGIGYKSNGITRLQTYEQIQSFYDIYSNPNNPDDALTFETFDLSASLSRVTLNRGTFPTAGSSQRATFKVTTPNSDVNYFKVNLDAKWYFPLTRNQQWTVLTRFQAGYGNGYGKVNGNDQTLPFWENFRAGGADTLRGFETNIVGPRAIYRTPSVNSSGVLLSDSEDILTPSFSSVGGNTMVIGGVELIVPTPFVEEGFSSSVRTSLFVDVGNVWDTEFSFSNYTEAQQENLEDYSSYEGYRSSAGLSVQWISPMGPMIFSFSKPLKKNSSDDTQFFTFNIGQTF